MILVPRNGTTRYFLGNRLIKFDERFSFSSIHLRVRLFFFYKKCLDNFLYSKYGYLPDDLSSKNIYALLFALPSATPRSAGF